MQFVMRNTGGDNIVKKKKYTVVGADVESDGHVCARVAGILEQRLLRLLNGIGQILASISAMHTINAIPSNESSLSLSLD